MSPRRPHPVNAHRPRARRRTADVASRAGPYLEQLEPRDLTIVERDRAGSELLVGLVSLPGDDDDVASSSLSKRQADRRAAVGLDHVVTSSSIFVRSHPLLDLSDDRERVFRARIVTGDDR